MLGTGFDIYSKPLINVNLLGKSTWYMHVSKQWPLLFLNNHNDSIAYQISSGQMAEREAKRRCGWGNKKRDLCLGAVLLGDARILVRRRPGRGEV